MQYVPTALRVLMGLIFVVFGLNGFLHFIALPPLPDAAGALLTALIASGYLFPLVKIVEIVGGLMLLAGRFVPLALTLLAPIVVNIFLFHVVLTPPNPVAIFLLVAEAYLGWAYRGAFRGMLAMNAKPGDVAA